MNRRKGEAMADSYLDMLRWYDERRARNERPEDDRDRLIAAMKEEKRKRREMATCKICGAVDYPCDCDDPAKMKRTLLPTRETLLAMAQKCAQTSERQNGTPLLDDAADLFERASHRVHELEDEVRRWRDAWAKLKVSVPQ
jgi:hypothetical protein